MTIMGPIQRAARITLGSADLEVRERCRHAPLWVRRRIDAARQQRGAAPLWGTVDATRHRIVAKVKRLTAFLEDMRQQTRRPSADAPAPRARLEG